MTTETGNIRALGWSQFVCTEEDRQGREVQMPQWVMDYACRHVDATNAAAVRKDADGYRLVNAYLWGEDIGDDVFQDPEDAHREADAYNDERGVVPLVISSSWAVLRQP